jgi:hypothetical protein
MPYQRPQDLLPLNRDDTFLAIYKEIYTLIRNAFIKQKKDKSSPAHIFTSSPFPDSGRTAEGLYIVSDENGVWRRLLTPAGSVELVEGGWLGDMQTLSKAINETLDWDLVEVDSSIATYVYFEEDDTVRGPFMRQEDGVYWVQRVDKHQTPATKPNNPYYYITLVISETSRAKDENFFDIHNPSGSD